MIPLDRYLETLSETIRRSDVFRSPADLIPRDVCPHCNRPVTEYRFVLPEGHGIRTWNCLDHGAVCPKRSHVENA